MRAGVVGGLVGGAVIWVYEAAVWAEIQHLLPLTRIPSNAVGLAFGNAVQERLGIAAGVLGTGIHFGFSVLWGITFSCCWPWLRRHGVEAALAALVLAPLIWIVMHAAIYLAGHEHPNYTDPCVVAGGVLSHLFFTVPMALVVKSVLRDRQRFYAG